ncbi:TnsA-like heteromeric transposase endonuclease subunit [Nocardia asiatica]
MNGAIVVDVKPRARLDKPAVRSTFGWTRDLVEARGWRYEVSSEPDAVELQNVRFLAGFRRAWLFDPVLLDELCDLDLEGISVRDACASLPDRAAPLVRSALFHLMWTKHVTADLTQVLSSSIVLCRRRWR